MSLKSIPDSRLIPTLKVLNMIHTALKLKTPFSLVRIGDGENIVLAQNVFLSPKEVLNTYWVKQSDTGRGKGVTLPNLNLRNKMIKAIRRADLVGICRQKNDEVSVPSKYKRELTNKLFEYYHLKPSQLCYVFVNRKMVSYRLFWEIIHRYRTLLISKWAEVYAEKITREYASLKPRIVGCLDFTHYKQIPDVLKRIGNYRFDLALISAGVNSVLLAPAVAEQYGKVALDFGKTMMYTVRPCSKINPWRPKDGSDAEESGDAIGAP
ncbi:MAG: hypothetical protein GX075_06585 [Firmicutes bacterium]|nr:hypothetical protein [Bacillota bacterium]